MHCLTRTLFSLLLSLGPAVGCNFSVGPSPKTITPDSAPSYLVVAIPMNETSVDTHIHCDTTERRDLLCVVRSDVSSPDTADHPKSRRLQTHVRRGWLHVIPDGNNDTSTFIPEAVPEKSTWIFPTPITGAPDPDDVEEDLRPADKPETGKSDLHRPTERPVAPRPTEHFPWSFPQGWHPLLPDGRGLNAPL